MTTVYLDYETYAATDLKTAGVYRYVQCPSFEALMCAVSVGGEEPRLLVGEQDIVRWLKPWLAREDTTFVAHNAPFERIVTSTLLGMPEGSYLPPEQWVDTQILAAEHGYPQQLEMLAKALGVAEKDTAGTRLKNLFSKPYRGRRVFGRERPEQWQQFCDYCLQDVRTLIEVERSLGGWPTEMERRMNDVDQRINDRGIKVDVELAQRAVEAAEKNHTEQRAEMVEITGVSNPGSRDQLLGWFSSTGLELPDLTKETVSEALSEKSLTSSQRRVLELRQELALVASKKYTAALRATSDDDRFRGAFAFFGAHTGRWSGRRIQLQNLPNKMPDDINGSIADLLLGNGADADTLKRLVRLMFTGPFSVVDYSSIEARMLAWLSGEEWVLEAARRNDANPDEPDIYEATAKQMSTPGNRLDRSQGKVAVLALGFAGGIKSLRVMGAEGSDEHLKRLRDQWRKANRKTVLFWRNLETCFGKGRGRAGRIRVTQSQDSLGRAVHLWLPSGRAITYHGVKWEKYVVINKETKTKIHKEGWRYADPKNPLNRKMRIGTYGGRLAENVTQAGARDVHGEALIRLEEAGYPVALHVHDEAAIENTDLGNVIRVMNEPPKWAGKLPINATGFTSDRYRKE